MIPSGSEAAAYLASEKFDFIKELNESVPSNKLLQEQHVACAELQAQLDNHIHDLVHNLRHELELLLKSERRVPHEIDLLRNDVKLFNEKLSDTLPCITTLATKNMRNQDLIELDELNLALTRMEEVISLLESSQNESTNRADELAVVFKGTPDESKYKRSYYDLFNTNLKKYIN